MPIAIAQKVWLITGCSSGLGHSLAMAALNNGHKVIATSRNPTRTPDLVRGVEAHGGHWLEFDVCGQRVDEVLDEALKIHGHIDVLVNNAGAGIYGAVEDCRCALGTYQYLCGARLTLEVTRMRVRRWSLIILRR